MHCWQDKVAEMEMISSFGKKIKSDWRHRSIYKGQISEEFLSFLYALPKPEDVAIYNKMTPFFTIQFSDTLDSSHYGTEILIMQAPPEAQEIIEKILCELEPITLVHRDF